MEILGPDRASVSSSLNVSVKGLVKVESLILDDALVGSKLSGAKGISVGTLLGRVRPQMGNGVCGMFVASDGIATDPIAYNELVKGYIVHSDASGSELPGSLGGPLRVIFPSGCAVQNSVCGTPKPVNLKGVIRLTLSSKFELKDATSSKALAEGAPRLIALLEECHSASLRAFAKHYCGVAQPARVTIAGLDARGFTLRVTTPSGEVAEDLLAPFPRPLAGVDDVLPLAMEMHRTAFAALPVSFKLWSRYYTEPLAVACRQVYRSPAALAATALVATAGVGVVIARARARR